jgi:predicted lipoprotein with Yx(FWY)xxD motif
MTSMTKYGLAGVTATALLVSACGSSASSPSSVATPGVTIATASVARGPSEIRVGETALGEVLVDGDGRTLYLYTMDHRHRSSTCDSDCAATWMPLIASQAPVAGSGVNTRRLSSVRRLEGTEQVTYDGWPLYRYAKDSRAGDTNGEKVGGVWFAVDPDGSAVVK